MKQRAQPGFTIIEVILFLAISSALAVGLMVGTNAAIQGQRYRDTVQSYAGFLRDQYSKVINVENDRSDDAACPVPGASASGERGQSSCVIVGRYIQTEGADGATDGRDYRAFPLYAHKSGDIWNYGYIENEGSSFEVGWGGQTRLSSQGENAAHIGIVMYRSPENGRLVVRIAPDRFSSTSIGAFVSNSSIGTTEQEICVYDRGWVVGERQSVYVGSQAGSSDTVTTANASAGCEDA